LSGATLKEQFLKLSDFKPMGKATYTLTVDRPVTTQTMTFKIEKGRLLPIND